MIRADEREQNHVNNVTYIRYAESARINWAYNYAIHLDPKHKREWGELWTPRGDGLILRSIRTDYKFVCCHSQFPVCVGSVADYDSQ
jgi:acyl-CoA thioesterase FadM